MYSNVAAFALLALPLVKSDVAFIGRERAPNHNGHHGIYDLTHTYEMDRMPVVDGGIPLEMGIESHDEGNGARSESLEFCMDEKLGTHIVAPKMYHHLNGSLSADNIPLDRLVNVPAVVIDLHSPSNMHDRMLTLDHVFRWEEKHGVIPENAYVILRSGWSHNFRQTDHFLGYFEKEPKQVFPGFSAQAVEWLLSSRGIAGLGTECIDVELGWKTKNAVKKLLAAQNSPYLVQLANVRNLPHRHVHLTIAPLKLKGGAGGPTRVYATVGARAQTRARDATTHAQTSTRNNKVPRSSPTETPRGGAAVTQDEYRVTYNPPSEQTLKSSSSAYSASGSLLALLSIVSMQLFFR